MVLGVGVGLSVLPETVLLPVLLVVTELVPVTELVVKGLAVTSGQRVSSAIPMCSDKRLVMNTTHLRDRTLKSTYSH